MICKYCGLDKPESDFKKCSVIKGITYYRLKCSSCKQATQRKRIAKGREAMIEFKKTLQCADCGTTDHRVFEFHHLDPRTKEENIGNLVGRGASLAKVKQEVEKCVVLCANCHRIRHFED